ncbi:MAG: GTP cyclohydrolase I FolE [Thermoleophilia bacterium]
MLAPHGDGAVPAGTEVDPEAERAERLGTIAALTAGLLEAVGEDASRAGLEKTPDRVARAWDFLTSGYRLDLEEVTSGAFFPAESSQMVIVREIDFYSLCEHHLLPFHGKAHIGYIPGETILGLSKFARITELFARRLQVQERLTSQIATAVMGLLQPQGVGVVVEAEHLCMAMRGVQKPGAITTTSCMLGVFRDDARTRAEFMEALSFRPGR